MSAWEIAVGVPAREWIGQSWQYVDRRLELFRHYNITPIFVLDGRRSPLKVGPRPLHLHATRTHGTQPRLLASRFTLNKIPSPEPTITARDRRQALRHPAGVFAGGACSTGPGAAATGREPAGIDDPPTCLPYVPTHPLTYPSTLP